MPKAVALLLLALGAVPLFFVNLVGYGCVFNLILYHHYLANHPVSYLIFAVFTPVIAAGLDVIWWRGLSGSTHASRSNEGRLRER
ncbi:MAG: hypothetical protein M1330_00700 [Armatimonadetes bacterium]|nr:hypothetical protein [Armatimonadota bacterium]